MISIRELQGDSLLSDYAGQTIVTTGVVTGLVRKGFFIQTPDKRWDMRGSDGIFVYSRDISTSLGAQVTVTGTCVNYIKHDTAKPVTQIQLDTLNLVHRQGPEIQPIELQHSWLAKSNRALASRLNSLEGMLMSIPAGSTFISPSNSFGDYVLALEEQYAEKAVLSTDQRGIIVGSSNHLRWFAGFRVSRYNHAQRVNVGAKLTSPVVGPLNYRVDSYQLSVNQPFEVEPNFVSTSKSSLVPTDGAVTVMTLNCFNLDPHVEFEDRVSNPRQDIDDDWGEGRFHTLAQAVVLHANTPDIVALQEIQDGDGAELTDMVDASETYELLIKTIEQLSGVRYQWVDVNPELGEDGGQPGGNIRNGYLYNPSRVELVEGSARVLGRGEAAFDDSRKPLLCEFAERVSGKSVAIINVHLASKRHQESIFAPSNAGVDGKLEVRVEQAAAIHAATKELMAKGIEYYVTGDFNDGEHSHPLTRLVGDDSHNLVFTLDPAERYDYNHRGKLQVLMHGIVSKQLADAGKAEYEIIHGNELIGVQPGETTDKPSDHAYVIAKLDLS